MQPANLQFEVYREFFGDDGLWNSVGEGPYHGGLQIGINATSDGYRRLAEFFQRLADHDIGGDENFHEHLPPALSVDGKSRVHLIVRKNDR